MCSCSKDYYNTKQTDYHEGLEEIEQEVLSVYGEYIKFSEPSEDPRHDNAIEWNVFFLRSYINSEKETDTLSPYQIIEDVREMLNKHLDSCELFEGKLVGINFIKPPRNRYTSAEGYASFASIQNYSFVFENRYDSFACINYENCEELADLVRNKVDVSEVVLFSEDVNEIAGIIEALPNVSLVVLDECLSKEEILQQLSQEYPYITFV